MTYVFDPTTNTLIDDEDKSFGNKLALNDDEFQKLLDIPGVFRASEAPQPPVRPDVQEIEAINRFMRDNPIEKAKGGRIGFSKGADTSPVYNEKTGHIYKIGNRFGEFYSKTPPKNQFTAVKPLRSLAELQKIIDEAPLLEINGKFFEQNAKDLRGDSEYSSKELISRKELEKGPDGVKNKDKLKFKSTGKKRLEEPNQGNINRRNKIIAFQGSEIHIRGGKKINKAFSHVYPIIESAKPGTKITTVIDADMNNKLIGYNRIGQKIAEDQEYLLKVKPEGYKKQILINNAKAKKNVMNAIQDLGKDYKGQIGYFQVDPETGIFKPKAGNYKMSFAGLEGENKIYKDMTSKERTAFSKKISDIEKLKTIPGITTADKIPVPEKSTTKSKILSGIGKGAKIVGKVIKPVGVGFGINAVKTAVIKAEEQGLELSNIDKAMAFDSGDADVALNNAKRRVDPEFAAQERAKDLAQMEDDFEEVGLDEIQPDETLKSFMANGGRVGFNNGGAAGADVDFATQLEYFLTNEDAELPQLSTYKETKNPIEVFNDIIDPRNYPYYADVLARSGLRIGEFGVRLLPATGKLIADAIQKGAFKIKETGNNYVQDYTDVMPSNIKGTGIFSEFLENITPTSLEKKIGLASLIEKEEQKQIDRGSTAGPKVFADTIGLGAEVTAPIFPGLKLLRAYAANRNLPVNDVTKKILVKEIDEVLETQGMNRREFLQATGAGATVVLAKMLGFGDEVAQTAKVVEKAAAAPAGVPPYFFQLAEIIKKKGFDVTKGNATRNLENVYSYNGYDLYEDIATGEIRIEKIGKEADMVTNREILEYKPGRADESTKGKPADEYEEVTETNSRIYKDEFNDPDYEEGVNIEEILEFIKNEKVN